MALAITVALAALGAFVPRASAATSTVDAPADEAQLVDLTNEARRAAGLPTLTPDAAAASVARNWARAMVANGGIRHNPDLVVHVDRYVTTEWTRIGENVGAGGSAQAIQDAFMASRTHRANVLGEFNRIGVGAVRDGNGRLWLTVVFLLGPPIAPASTAPAWSPFPSPERFAEQQYLDFLGRTGDAGGVAHWANQLRAGSATAAGVAEAFLRSAEFDGVMAPVGRLYFGAFARIPDQPGLQAWLDARRSGASLGAIAAAFASSEEFRSRYDALDNAGFVDALYRTVFGRGADASALQHWAGELDAGRIGRGDVLLGVTSSAEFVWTSASEVSTTMAYVGLLRRTPDAGGFAYWVAELDAGRPFTDLLTAHLASAEYRARF